MTTLTTLLADVCKKTPRTIEISALSFCLMVAAGCYGKNYNSGSGSGSSSGSSITVTVTSSASTISAGQTANITASVANDSYNMGVSWSVSGGGTLSNETSTTAVYNAPSSVTANTTVTITATSVANSSASGYVMITVTPAAAITVKITDPISTIAAGAAAVTLNATVQNDSTNSGVTWTLTAGGANCTSTTCGTLSSATTTSVMYTPPAGTPASPYNAPTITATSVANTSATATDPFTITAPASLPISISLSNQFTTIAAGAAAVTLTAAVQNDPTDSGVTWTLTSGGAACSNTCGTLSAETTTSVTYTPPSTVPASPDNAPTITATSIADTAVSTTDAFTITSASANNDGMFKGQYAFLVSGNFTVLGSITANGSGGITGGEVDIAGVTPFPRGSSVAITGGTYTVDASDNRGTLSCTGANGSALTFAFALGTVVNGVATKGQMMFEGYPVSGSLALQSSAAFSTSALNGPYAFGLHGADGAGNPEVSVGSFRMSGGTISNGLEDVNDNGTLLAGATLTGSLGSSIDSNGRGTFTVTVQGESGSATGAFYVVSGAKLFALINSSPSSNLFLDCGEILQQTGGPYSLASLNGTAIVSEQAGGGPNSLNDILGIGTFNASGSASFSFDQVQGSGTDQQTTGTAAIVLDSAASGRFTLTPSGGSNIILYMIAPNQAFLLDTSTDTGFGLVEPQTAETYSNSVVQGSYFFGTLPLGLPLESAPGPNSIGVVTINSTGAISGTSDDYSSSGSGFTLGNAISGSLTLGANGRATTTNSSSETNSVIYFASPTKFYILTIPSGSSGNPAIGIGEQ